MSRAFVAGLTLVVAALGCTSGSGGTAPALSGLFEHLAAPQNRQCMLISTPEALPAEADLVALEGLRETLVENDGDLRGYVLLALSTSRDSTFYRPSLLETDLDSKRAELLRTAVERHLLAAPASARFTVLLKLDTRAGGPRQPSVSVGQSEGCPPALRNRLVVKRMLARGAGLLADRRPGLFAVPGLSRRVELWLFVDSAGSVARSEVKQSSGVADVDSVVLRVTPYMVFEPGLYNRRPTGVWVSQWLTLESGWEPD